MNWFNKIWNWILGYEECTPYPLPKKYHPPKLTQLEAESIRRLYRSGMTQAYIASMYGVSRQTISDVVRFKTWLNDEVAV